MNIIKDSLNRNPIIAACTTDSLSDAVDSDASMVLLIKSSLNRLIRPDFQNYCRLKSLFIHVDMVKGLTGDRESLQFVRDFIRPAGIISTRSTTIRAARSEGLRTIQRVFLIDTSSLRNSISSIEENRPDAVEIMPGIAPGIYSEIRRAIELPLIAAGLIHSREDIANALEGGADGVSLSEPSLWNVHAEEIISDRSLQRTL